MTIHLAAIFVGCLTLSGPAQNTPLPLPFRLESDGHACTGYLKLTKSELIWKSSFSTCRARWAGRKQGDGWLLDLDQKGRSKGCTFSSISIHRRADMDGIWDVAGYTGKAHTLDSLVIDCPWMQAP